ncbi:MAG: ribonuclease HII [Candidatus Moranbacteria bacterium CG_4_9_14_3_um_filter_42_9]|nr:MAG: ribonuclease HII [Candidatus Moranbacteria bacterium CG_4_9_14_3_um_filter_42_9]
MIKSTFQLENKLSSEGYEIVIGIDEAGRGPLAGPVVACAASLKNLPHPPAPSPGGRGWGEGQFDLVRDSKTLSEKQREKLYDFICENFHVGIGICDHETIDRINILEASFLAMKKATTSLMRGISNSQLLISNQIPNPKSQNTRLIVLLDGNKKIPNFSIEQKAIVNGDKYIKSISAASIIAKVTRDRIMLEMHEKYPEYQFDRHKGYGTKLHMDSLQKYGPCAIHRKSFAPVRKSLLKG